MTKSEDLGIRAEYVPLLLRSGRAFYSYPYATLNVSASETDDSVVLHEVSHLLTYAGTDFAGHLARIYLLPPNLDPPTDEHPSSEEDRRFKARRKQDELFRFFEAIPETLNRLKEPVAPGTRADPTATGMLVESVRRYHELFRASWAMEALRDFHGLPPGGDFQALPTPSNLEMTLAIVHVVLDWTLVRGKAASPVEALSDLHGRLIRGGGLRIPWTGATLREHVRDIFGYGERTFVEMFFDHFQLASVLLEVPMDRMHRYLGLLPALAGIEFLIEVRAEGPRVALFPYQEDYRNRKDHKYIARRLRDQPRQELLRRRIRDLSDSLNPKHCGSPVVADPNDALSQSILTGLALKAFFKALPDFIRHLFAEAPGMFDGAHFDESIQALKASSDEAVETYVKAAATDLGLPALLDMLRPYELVLTATSSERVFTVSPLNGE